MPNAEARVATDRARRYLSQLCRHAGQMGRHTEPGHRPRTHGGGGAPPEVRHADVTDSRGTIDLGWGRCSLRATDDALLLRAEADDDERLRRIEDGIAERLEKIGRRDRLTVTWHRVDASAGRSAAATDPTASAYQETAMKRPAHGRRIALIAVGTLIVAVHLGLAGAVLNGSAWTAWGMNAVLVIVLVKLAAMGGHEILGRLGARVVRHRRRHTAPAVLRSAMSEGDATNRFREQRADS